MLNNLQLLDLSKNILTILPDWLAQLTKLESLDLSENNLMALPDGIAQLQNLQCLDIHGNKLNTLPDWLAQPDNLPQLRDLYIANNPLSTPPNELLGNTLTKITRADIATIRTYFRQLQEATAVYFYEAKLLIIGEGGAGKTSLARKLLAPEQPLLPQESSTEGVDVLTWQFPLPPHLPKQAEYNHYTANIWDFGGQEIYFATHQFFLTRRSVYLLVADTRRQHTDFYTWLRMQETFGDDSPVLLVKNRNRQHGNSFTIENLPQLRERFPNLREVVEVDLNDAPQDQGWQELLQQVERYLLKLPHIGQPRPATWVAVRTALRDDERDIMPWPAFVTLCQAQGMKRAEDIQQLGEYLHNLGDILYFHDDPVLRDYVIRNPSWGLAAVYKVLDNRAVEQALGQFTLAQLRDLWRDPIYDGYHIHLLRLMENFQLCYPLEGVRDTYIAPQLLTEELPSYDWESSENLQLRYVYPLFMPRGILSRLIVKLHRRIEVQRLVWRSGVILNDGYARAEVLELRGDQQIRIRVSGRNKRDLLMEIVRALDDLHLSFPKLRVERRLPCNCAACLGSSEPYFFALEKLLERLANRKETIECQNPPYHEVPIAGLLSEIGPWAGRGLDRWGGNVHIANLYWGDVVGGDKIDGDKIGVGDISEATNVAIGKEIASSLSNSG